MQEIITNTARHAQARNLWIRLESRSDGIALHARDDGRGADVVACGNGLTGMRERFEQFAGHVEFNGRIGTGIRDPRLSSRPGDRMIRIVLVDDQTLVRQGIRSLLELVSDVSIVGEASDGDEAVSVIRREKPDVVLLDLRMPKKDGVDVLRDLQGASMLPPTIVLTTFDDDEALLDAVKAGAKGYFLKDVSLERLTDGIREVARGGSVIRPAITERVLKGLEHVRREFDSLSPPDSLTKREMEILRLMAGGYSNREIAEALGTAEGTVKNHASSILSKLGVRDRTRAVLKALELGYI